MAYARGVCVPDTCTKEDVRAYLTGANNVTSCKKHIIVIGTIYNYNKIIISYHIIMPE